MHMNRFAIHLITSPADPTACADRHELVIMPADRMRAERASTTELAPSQRADRKAHRETWLLLWFWCAAKRLGITALGFEAFADTVADYDALDVDGQVVDPADADELEAEPVDPTQPVANIG